MRLINADGLKIIKESEGLRLKAYLCPANVPTIGYGHTHGVTLGDSCTAEEAERFLKWDLQVFESGVNALLTPMATDNQFSACVSLAFNIGMDNFKKSNVLKFTNSNQIDRAITGFSSWVRGGGVVLPGLVKRRKLEAELFQR